MPIGSLARFTLVGKWGMRSLLIVIIRPVDCRKKNFAGRTTTNRTLSHIYSTSLTWWF